MQRITVVSRRLKMLLTPPVSSCLRLGYDPSTSTAMNFELTFMQDDMADERDYVDLGRSCADVCKALDRGLKRRRWDEISPPVLDAIEQLTS